MNLTQYLVDGDPPGGVTGEALPSAWVNVEDYGAPTGVDDSPAFLAAIAALPAEGGRIIIPATTVPYTLLTDITSGTRSIYWDIDPGARFSTYAPFKFPCFQGSNATIVPYGPFVSCKPTVSIPDPDRVMVGSSAISAVMLPGKDYKSCCIGLTAAAHAAGNPIQGQNVWGANIIAYSGGQTNNGIANIVWGIEVDVGGSSDFADHKGIVITGSANTGVQLNVGLEVSYTTQASTVYWKKGIDVTSSIIGLSIGGGSYLKQGIKINTEYTGASDLGYVLGAKQLKAAADTIVLQRFTNTSPQGSFFRCLNTAGTVDVLRIDTLGNITTDGYISPITDVVASLGSLTKRWLSAFIKTLYFGAGTTLMTSGVGSPEGAVTAAVGSLYTNTTGTAGTVLYVKESGAGNTGWVAK